MDRDAALQELQRRASAGLLNAQEHQALQQVQSKPKWLADWEKFKATDWKPTTYTDPNKEMQFRNWIVSTPWGKEFAQNYGENNLLQELGSGIYDYRKAFELGIMPEVNKVDNRYHWPDSVNGAMLKSPQHPTGWMEFFYNETGTNPDDIGVRTPEDAIKWQQQATTQPSMSERL